MFSPVWFLPLVILITLPSQLFGAHLDLNGPANQLYDKNNAFLNAPIVRGDFLQNQTVRYTRIDSKFWDKKIEYSLQQLRNPSTPVTAIYRYKISKWVPSLLLRAQEESNDFWESPWGEINSERDTAAEEVEVLSILKNSQSCTFNTFLKFDIYPIYAKESYLDYFLASYSLNTQEINLLKLPLPLQNEIYHYSIFYAPFLGTYQSVVRYVYTDNFRDIQTGDKLIRIPQKLIAWEIQPVGDFSTLPGRGNIYQKNKEKEHRDAVNHELYANNGYVILEPLVLDGIPQGEHQECSLDGSNCQARTSNNHETLLNGNFYLRPDVDFGEDFVWERQLMMEHIINSIVTGIRKAIMDAANGKILIEGCR